MKDKLLKYCKAENLFIPGERVICGVSGGADSMALLHCLHSMEKELEICVEAAHFNHGLRGQEAQEDQDFVRDFCREKHILLHVGQADVRAYGKEHRVGTEEAARLCRYDFFHSLGSKVATAHNADDNLETVLMHLIRGSGLRGLCGIPPKRGQIVRPLLWATREEILAYLKEAGISYREDSSNASLSYTRNRIRQQVLPLLRQENPKVAKAVLQQSGLLRREDILLDQEARGLIQKNSEGAYLIQPLLDAQEPLKKRALRLIIGEYLEQDVSLRHIEALEELLENACPSAQLSLPRGLVAHRRYESLCFTWEEQGIPEKTLLRIPGETVIPGSPWKIFSKIQKNFIKKTNTPFHFALKYDMISVSDFLIRSRQVGDRLQMQDGHSKSLKKLMIEKKIPKADRDFLPVFTQGDRILAVGGLGVSSDCSPQEGEAALIIVVERGEYS